MLEEFLRNYFDEPTKLFSDLYLTLNFYRYFSKIVVSVYIKKSIINKNIKKNI